MQDVIRSGIKINCINTKPGKIRGKRLGLQDQIFLCDWNVRKKIRFVKLRLKTHSSISLSLIFVCKSISH